MSQSTPVTSSGTTDTTPSRAVCSRVAFTTPRSAAHKSNERSQSCSGSSKRLHAAFKSPLRRPDSSPAGTENSTTLQQEVAALELKDADLSQQIENLVSQGYKEEELSTYMEGLHAYNEMKDIGQMLLGRLAVQLGVTTRELYSRFELQLDD